jgi:hypothetical protein
MEAPEHNVMGQLSVEKSSFDFEAVITGSLDDDDAVDATVEPLGAAVVDPPLPLDGCVTPFDNPPLEVAALAAAEAVVLVLALAVLDEDFFDDFPRQL